MTKIIHFILIFLLIVVALALPDYYRTWAKPFRQTKSNIRLPFQASWETVIQAETKSELETILSQPFSYLGQGMQSFAFLSADGNYVLKLFRFDPCKMKYPQFLIQSIKKKLGRKIRYVPDFFQNAENRLNASKLAYDFLQDETGLLLVHLNPESTTSWPLITIKDKLGFTHSIDPTMTRFVLQKKADKIFPALSKALKNDPESFRRMVHSATSLLASFEKKGITTDDSKMPSNFGFIGEHAIQIDFASNNTNPGRAQIQMEIFRKKLQSWLQRNAPDTND